MLDKIQGLTGVAPRPSLRFCCGLNLGLNDFQCTLLTPSSLSSFLAQLSKRSIVTDLFPRLSSK